MQIKDLAVGDDFVYLNEDSSKVKFYVLAHNYESGLNGKGRTLFCRESIAHYGLWAGYTSSSNINMGWPDRFESWGVAENAARAYLRDTYLNRFDAATKKHIGTTKYNVVGFFEYAGSSSRDFGDTKVGEFSSEIFTISAAESITSYRSKSGGTLLSQAARTRLEKIFTIENKGIWTRTLASNTTYEHSDDGDSFHYDGIYLNGVSSSDWGVFSYSYNHTSKLGYLPCFTLPETLYIDKDGFAMENQPPEVTSDVGESGVALGDKNAPFTVGYTVTDGNGDPMRIVEKVNGVELAVRENVASGTELTVQCLSEKALFQQILNGENTLVLEADDGRTTTEWTATFTKNVTRAVLSLAQPLTADDTITVAALTFEGTLPEDMSLTVEMTNNALDDSPVWENCTDIPSGESRAFVHHAFTNKTATKGAAFNYKVTITRGESGVGGSITMIGGVIG